MSAILSSAARRRVDSVIHRTNQNTITHMVTSPTMAPEVYTDAELARRAVLRAMRDGSPVSLTTTTRVMTPLGPVNQTSVARY